MKSTVVQLTYIPHDTSISCKPYMLISYEPGNCNLRCMGVKFLF